MLWLIAFAFAHSPHDVVRSLSVVNGQVVLGEDTRMAWSGDNGETILHGDSPGGSPDCLATVSGTPGGVVLVTDTPAAFVSANGGASWSALDLDGPAACAPGASGALVWDAAGAHRIGVDHDDLVVPDPLAVTALAESPDGTLIAITRGGSLLRNGASGWESAGTGPYTAITAGGGVLLRASTVGIEVSRDEGDSWSFVTDIPATTLGAGPTAWMATTNDDGVWISEDQGETWVVDRNGLEELAVGSGAPAEGAKHWFNLVDDDGTLWAAAWEGLYRRAHGDPGWTQIQTRSLPLVRDLTWVSDGLLTAPYGGGLAIGVPAETGWVDAAPRLSWPWLRTVLATENGDGRWFFVGGQHLYISDDRGRSVTAAATDMPLDGDVVAVAPGWPADAHVWETAEDDDGEARVLESDDGGLTWASTVLADCGQKGSAIVTGEPGVFVGCGTTVWRREGPGVWSPLPGPDARINALLLDGEALLAGTPDGVWRGTREGLTARLYGPTPVDSMALEPDGALLVGGGEGLVRVVAGVATPLGWPDGDVVMALNVAADGRIAAGTFSGAWVSEDAGATWLLATDWDRFDDADTAFQYGEGWVRQTEETAKARGVHSGGESLRWRVEAARLALAGAGPATFEVSIDGGEPEAVTVDDEGLRRLWAGAVEPGWHTLELDVTSGDLRFDGGERWRLPGELAAVEAPEPEPECGCASGGGATGFATAFTAAAIATATRRRRRRSPPGPV